MLSDRQGLFSFVKQKKTVLIFFAIMYRFHSPVFLCFFFRSGKDHLASAETGRDGAPFCELLRQDLL